MDGFFVPQGWQCPVCKRVYSPNTPMCYSCGNYEVTTTTELRFDKYTDDWLRKYLNHFNDKEEEYEK